MTDGKVVITAGTMYGSLSKMEKDGLISFVREEEKRKLISPLGHEVFALGTNRIKGFYRNIGGECFLSDEVKG